MAVPADVSRLNARRIELLEAGKVDEATRVCRTWLSKADPADQAEAHKCVANIFVHQATPKAAGIVVTSGRQRLSVGGMAGPQRFSGDEIAPAVDHLDQAAVLSPADLSIHEGRLFLCVASGLYARAVASLELSLSQYHTADAATWLQYMPSFPRSAATHAVDYLTLVAKSQPDHERVLLLLGGWQTAAGQAEAAKATLAQLISLAPRDPMAHWRMGEALAALGDRRGAKRAFHKSLRLGGPMKEARREALDAFLAGGESGG